MSRPLSYPSLRALGLRYDATPRQVEEALAQIARRRGFTVAEVREVFEMADRAVLGEVGPKTIVRSVGPLVDVDRIVAEIEDELPDLRDRDRVPTA
jgi:hypothetical protein